MLQRKVVSLSGVAHSSTQADLTRGTLMIETIYTQTDHVDTCDVAI